MILEVKRVYTLSGIKYRYKLNDFTYGEWLIFKNNHPVYYFNVFDQDYEHFTEAIKADFNGFLIACLKRHGLDLEQKILGITSIKSYSQLINLEKLPAAFLIN